MNSATTNKRKTAEPAPLASKKGKSDVKTEELNEEEDTAPPTKKTRDTPAPKKPKVNAATKKIKAAPTQKTPKARAAPKKVKLGPAINEIPTQRLDIYVFGEGSAGELGL